MLRNLILSAWRSLLKKVGFTVTNIFGLAIGMTTCLAIFLYVDYDLSYDEFQDDDVYRMWINRVYPEREVNYPLAPHSFGPQMVEDFPEVIAQGRAFKPFNPTTVTVGEDAYFEDNIIFADSLLLSVLNLPLKVGNPEEVLSDANSVVLSESIAQKLFGNRDPMGQTVEFFGQSKKVTGVAFDYPHNSHFIFDYLTPMHQFPFFNQENWVGFSAMIYLKLQPGTDPMVVEGKIPAFVKHYAEGPIQRREGVSYDAYVEAGNGYNYHLMHIKDIHLHSNLENEMKANGNINYVYIFSIVAVFILLIACINFMNLSTARSTERGKEVGIRKVLGSAKQHLIAQFLTESILMSIFSALAALGIVALILPWFSELAGRPLNLIQVADPLIVLVMIGIVVFIGVLAGLYPAFFISSFAPLSVLKGKLKGSKAGIGLRNALVVLQFSISIILISATLIVFNQMDYMQNKPLGFEKDNVIVIENAGAINGQAQDNARFDTFKNEIDQLPQVQVSDYSSNMPGDQAGDFSVRVPGAGEKESMIMRQMAFGDDLPDALQMQVLEGRFFSKDFEDSLSIVLNKSAVDKLGLVDPIGKKVIEIAANAEPREYTIVGIINDFHFQSLHVDLKPAAFTSMEGPNQFRSKLVISVEGGNIENTLRSIERKWAEFVPQVPFKSYFLDANMEAFYESELATGRIFSVFTLLAILIACIGLLGLSAFIINQRVKEIGVRKVMGASVPQIVLLLSSDFLKLVGLSAVLAIPVAYYWMKSWLESFAYAAGINWLVFVLAGGIALFIGLSTVSYQSIRAAVVNPVKSLKDE